MDAEETSISASLPARVARCLLVCEIGTQGLSLGTRTCVTKADNE